MSDRTVSFSELASESLIEVGAGRPRTVLEQYPSLPILRVADVLDGRIESSSQERVPDNYRKVIGSKISRPGDVVLTVKGTVGRVSLMPPDGPDFAYSPQLCYFRPAASGPLRSRYLYYWFKSTQFWNQANALKGQTDMADYLSLSDIQALEIRIPPPDRQDGIIEVLGSLDDKIAVNEQIAHVSSNLISMLFQRALARSNAMTVPLSDAVCFDFGLPFTSESFNNGRVGLPLLRIRDIKTFSPQVWTTERIARDVVVDPGDVVAGMDAEFRPAFWLGAPALLNQRVLRGRSLREGGSRSFVREVLRKPLSEIEGHKTGTTVIHLNKRDLDLSFVEIPAISELGLFESAAEPLRCRIVEVAGESRNLTQLRDMLLPKLMSGEIRVRDAEKVVEDVM
jgi:type I restriction enzyme, S subunit